jgi:hypothetical protein
MNPLVATLWLGLMIGAASSVAAPLVPHDDAEVVEVLPAATASRAEQRRWHREQTAHAPDAGTATALARRLLGHARDQGDPRFAGQALAALESWPDPARAPNDVLLMQATVDQYLHDFDAAATKLELLVRRAPRDAQAWLTLATVRRVQGRYPDSDAACRALAEVADRIYGAACHAENEGLKGRVVEARSALARLIAVPGLAPDTAAWLLTTLAELEARAGNAAGAEVAYRAALARTNDAYTTISYADFLLERGRNADVLVQLRGEPRSDPVLLRLAIAGTRTGTADGARDAHEMRERIALANARPDARMLHAREQAMFALWVDADPPRALEFARVNVRRQREPVDLRVLFAAARASGDATALREADRLGRDIGLVDRRFDAFP